MTGGSQQLRLYRIARRDGATRADACAASGIDEGEAALHDADDAKNPPPPEAYVLLRGPDPEAAGCAVTTEEDDHMDNDDSPVIATFAADTLRGDVRDAMLSWFKATPKPWGQMGEHEQRDFVDTVDRVATQIVKQACEIIAANERPCIVAKLVQYTEKDGVEAKLKLASTGANVAALHEACGSEVLVVTSGFEDVAGEAAPAEIDADQPGIPGIGDEYDEAA